MTVCLLVKSDKRLFALCDGRLSRDDDTVSFDTTRKIHQFPLEYRYPSVSMGRFSSFKKYIGETWFVMYAGNYTLANEVINNFRNSISGLILDRDDHGNIFFGKAFNKSGTFGDSFNFDRDELLPLDARLVLDFFVESFEEKAAEWISARGSVDCTFIVFGYDNDPRVLKSYIVSIDTRPDSIDGRVFISKREIPNGELAAIGSQLICSNVFSDTGLQRGIETWKHPEPSAWDDLHEDAKGNTLVLLDGDPPVYERIWNSDDFLKEMLRHINEVGDPSVGGNIHYAETDMVGQISIFRMSREAKI